jgi:prophage tail gpP-like protein
VTARRDNVVLVVGDVEVSTWVSYRLDSDLMTPADGFACAVDVPPADIDGVRSQLALGSRAELWLDRVLSDGRRRRSLQMVGYITKRRMKQGRDGTELTVSGTDIAGILVKANAPPGLLVDNENTGFLSLVRRLVEQWDIEVIADESLERSIRTGERRSRRASRMARREAREQGVSPERYSRAAVARARAEGRPLDEALGVESAGGANFAGGMTPSEIERLQIREARPQPNESVWEYIDRHARRFGVMPWMTADGKLVIGAPNFGQEPTFRIVRRRRPISSDPNNVMDGALEQDLSKSWSTVVVYGRGSSPDGTRGRVRSLVLNPEWAAPFEMPRYVHDRGVRSSDDATRRGSRELSEGRLAEVTLSYTMDGHGQGDVLWAQNTTAYVLDEVLGIDGVYYIASRRFEGDRNTGTRTRLTLIQLGSIVL